MADHYPECVIAENNDDDRFSSWLIDTCICDRLRACEARAYALGIEVGKHDGWIAGHAAAERRHDARKESA